MTRDIAKYLWLGIIMALLAGCASTKKEVREPPPEPPKEKMNESFDPVELDDEDISFTETETQTPESVTPDLPEKKKEPVNRLVEGFRVQLFSTKNLENASRAKYMAAEKFTDMNIRFYLEFDSPYYKVRMGDFRSREEAEQIRRVAQNRGYPKAWIVKTKVWSHPEITPADTTQIGVPGFEDDY